MSIYGKGRNEYFSTRARAWEKIRGQTLLGVWKKMRQNVPAFKKFLKAAQVPAKAKPKLSEPGAIGSSDKRNYFFQYPLREQFYDGKLLHDSYVVTATSGSTGKPAYFFRNDEVDRRYAQIARWFLSLGPQSPTLLVDCFGMGVWIGGLITYQAFRYAGLSGYPVSVITPGVNKKEIFQSLRALLPQFKSVILAGYPPFIKDLLDEARSEKIFFRPGQIRLVFAAEGFSEQFRDYVAKRAEIRSVYLDTMNIYGSAELGAMAFETPLTILARRICQTQPRVAAKLFLPDRVPTLAQYDPRHLVFEAFKGRVLITGDSAMPFFRYQIGDIGAVHTTPGLTRDFASEGIDFEKKLAARHLPFTTLPLVAVYEREDFSTKLYGAIMYPAHVREGLQAPALLGVLTGKFSMTTELDKRQNQFLKIFVELKRKIMKTKILQKKVEKKILESLLKHNAEYYNNYLSFPQKVCPHVDLLPQGESRYFSSAGKQHWVI